MPKKGFTLIEVLIATSIFTMAAVMASTILVNVVQLEKKGSIQNAVYQDLRILMQQLSNEVQNGTIDYEEYYNMKVIQGNEALDSTKFYGINYGVYSSRFYDPGKRIDKEDATNPKDLGVQCSYPDPLPDGEDCEIYFTNSNDLNTGQNPYNDNNQAAANAFCDAALNVACNANFNTVDELYLIDHTGTKKTIIGLKTMNALNEKSLAIVRMEGRDFDQNGIVDIFSCTEEFSCFVEEQVQKIYNEIKYSFIQEKGVNVGQDYLKQNNVSLPQKSDLAKQFDPKSTQFIPISPKSINIKNLTFIINPVENPYLAYAEKSVQTHPSVTILITFNLADEVAKSYPGTFPDLTLQTTVAAGVVGKIEAYPPVNDVLKDANDKSWIDEVI